MVAAVGQRLWRSASGDSRQLPVCSGCAVPHGAPAQAEMAADKAAGECRGRAGGHGPAVPAPGLRRQARRDTGLRGWPWAPGETATGAAVCCVLSPRR